VPDVGLRLDREPTGVRVGEDSRRGTRPARRRAPSDSSGAERRYELSPLRARALPGVRRACRDIPPCSYAVGCRDASRNPSRFRALMVQGTELDDGGLATRGEQGSWPRLLTAPSPTERDTPWSVSPGGEQGSTRWVGGAFRPQPQKERSQSPIRRSRRIHATTLGRLLSRQKSHVMRSLAAQSGRRSEASAAGTRCWTTRRRPCR
jgi:hypothetical protein